MSLPVLDSAASILDDNSFPLLGWLTSSLKDSKAVVVGDDLLWNDYKVVKTTIEKLREKSVRSVLVASPAEILADIGSSKLTMFGNDAAWSIVFNDDRSITISKNQFSESDSESECESEDEIVEAPAVVEVVVEAPAAVEAPVVDEAPAVVETPAVVEAPAAVEAPVVEVPATVVEVPVIVEIPVIVDIPIIAPAVEAKAEVPAPVPVPVPVPAPVPVPVPVPVPQA